MTEAEIALFLPWFPSVPGFSFDELNMSKIKMSGNDLVLPGAASLQQRWDAARGLLFPNQTNFHTAPFGDIKA